MQLTIARDLLLQAINLISKAADKRHNMVILGNMKLVLTETHFRMTASDLEFKLQVVIYLPAGACQTIGKISFPANKFKDIVKLLPENLPVVISVTSDQQCLIVCGSSRFKLSTLPAEDFPLLGEPEHVTPIQLARETLVDLLDKTNFAMAIQDVRYYLTGMLFELKDSQLATVATDGHRLALARSVIAGADEVVLDAILPRKAVLELQRLLGELKRALPNQNHAITLNVGREFLQVILPFSDTNSEPASPQILVAFTARLIDGKFPDYRRVMPSATTKVARIPQEQLANVLRRVAILSNEKSRGVIFEFLGNQDLEIRASNAEQDEAREKLSIAYSGEPLEISFNVAYLLDVLNVLQGDIEFHMSQANSSVLVHQLNDSQHEYVIMPMRI